MTGLWMQKNTTYSLFNSFFCEKMDTRLETVQQHLQRIHDVAAIEAIGLAAKAGLNTRQVYDIISSAAGSSASFQRLVPQLLGDNSSDEDEDTASNVLSNTVSRRCSHFSYGYSFTTTDTH